MNKASANRTSRRMPILPPLFRPPAPGEKLRVIDLVQFHSPISGGVKRFVGDKCRFLETVPDVEHRVVVPGATHGEDRWGASRVHTIASPRLVGSASYRVLRDREAIRRIVGAFRPHVIEVGDPYLTAWIGRRVAHELPARIVGFYHSDYPRAWHRTVGRFCGEWTGTRFETLVTAYLRRLYSGMDALVVATPPLEALWRARGLGHVRRIPLGVDTGRFYPRPPEEVAAVRPEWGLPEDARVLLFVGRLAREKRIDWLVRVHARLRAADPRLHLVLIGDGEWRERVRGWAAAPGAGVHWRPYLDSGEALAAAYSAADVFVHAGMGETFGLSLLEAQACGLPAVAPAGSGMDDTLLPLAGNALAPADDEAAWAAAVAAALAAGVTPAARTARHAAVKGAFAWWLTYERLLGLYRELAGVPSPGRVSAAAIRPLGGAWT
jgi:alpha-1,6-mannosyltransferase